MKCACLEVSSNIDELFVTTTLPFLIDLVTVAPIPTITSDPMSILSLKQLFTPKKHLFPILTFPLTTT